MKWTSLVAAACRIVAASLPPLLLLLLLLAAPPRCDSAATTTSLSFDGTAAAANKLGAELYKISSRATGLHELRKDYTETYQVRVRKKDGGQMVESYATAMQELFKKRLEAVQRIKYKAEELHKKHEFVTDHAGLYKIPFLDAKKVGLKTAPRKSRDTLTEDNDEENPESEFAMKPSERFYDIAVNFTNSTVHVPTNIYSRAPDVIGNISWSGKLDDYFRRNWEENLTQSWQYFASSVGFLRYFPGAKWRFDADDSSTAAVPAVDLYDARMSSWYTQAASQPKNMVLLLDSSGSLKGRRMQVAKATLLRILDTLNENDFFNVIVFNNETHFLDNCANHTLMQATYQNKKRIEAALETVETQKIANFVLAFTEAFELLFQVNDTQQCAQCNNVLMVITDGSPESHEEVFRKYNWDYDKWVRVFTYLIGQEIPENDAIKVSWMACANRGYFYHIYTMADVQEHVQDYLRVMSRPLAIKSVNHTLFTGITINQPFSSPDASQANAVSFSDSWVKLPDGHKPEASITVAVPVYDKSETTAVISSKTGLVTVTDNGKLLGVAATDVSLEEITSLVPKHKLGANGYFFIITNNGFIVSHPYFRPLVETCASQRDQGCQLWQLNTNAKFMQFGSAKPGYNNLDLMQLENDDANNKLLDALRTAMIDQEVGNLTVNATGYFDSSMSRVRIQTQTYHYHPIRGTVYSLAIALPKKIDAFEVCGELGDSLDTDDFNTKLLEIANWTYCTFTAEELAKKSRLKLLLELFDLKSKEEIQETLKEKCDKELVQQLFFDARVTRGLLAIWMGNNNFSDAHRSSCRSNDQGCREQPAARATPAMSSSASRKAESAGGGRVAATATAAAATPRGGAENPAGSGVELVFVGTQSGLTRYLQLVERPSSYESTADYIARRTDTLNELYYSRASYAGNDTWVYSVPFNSHKQNESNIVVTASTGLFVKTGNRVGMAAALGLQMKYAKLKELMMALTFPCHGSKTCKQSCSDENITCYLVDNNAYVVISEHIGNVGLHFREVDYQAMEELEQADIFKMYIIADHQALCTVCVSTKSLASKLLSPLVYLYKLAYWITAEFALFLVEFNLRSWLTGWSYAAAESETCTGSACNSSIASTREAAVDGPVPCSQIQLHNELLGSFTAVQERFTNCYDCKMVKVVEDDDYVDIDNGTEVFDDTNYPIRGGKKRVCKFVPAPCSRAFAVHRVPKTNLFLIVVEAGCPCESTRRDPGMCMEAHEIAQECTSALGYGSRYRRLPGVCFNKLLKEDDSRTCGRATSTVSALALWQLAFMAALAVYLQSADRATTR